MPFKIDFRAIFGKAADQLFALALTHPDTFHGTARPILEGQSGGDISKARALAENEAFIRFGPGLAPVLLNKLVARLMFLHRDGQLETAELDDFRRRRWRE